MKRHLLMLLVGVVLLLSCKKNLQPGFAIVVDEFSYLEIEPELKAYAQSINQQGLSTSIIVDMWHHPDSIRKVLKTMYGSKKHKLEGVVFVGDIPIPMLRGAQHLSSAFKMDEERYPMVRSSIPSDRFYDDFDLQFELIEQDQNDSLLFYYRLLPESPQHLSVDIYSARIKPNNYNDKHLLLKDYLKKIVAYKNNPDRVDQILLFHGHGYNSESLNAWMDEKITLNQQFDYLLSQKNLIQYLNFTLDTHVKFRLLSELKRTDLDLAFLHHHGGVTAQYLSGMPAAQSNQASIENIKYYLRSKLRSANRRGKNLEETKQYYYNWLDIPASWFEGTFDPEQTQKDSLFNANLDIYLEDLAGYSSNARFIQLDACFNGSFQKEKYIASEYIFDEGNTIAVQANSVNVLQDKWSGEMSGLLGLGIRIGLWHKMSCFLETHLIGDPTLYFTSPDKDLDVNHWMHSQIDNLSFWEKQLDYKYADVQSLALRMIFNISGQNMSALYLSQFKNSPYNSVRMEAFKLLSLCNNHDFIEAINWGINDSYEYIQRMSATFMGKTGDPSHIPFLIDALLQNNKGKRVSYQIKETIGRFDKDLLIAELQKQAPTRNDLLDPDKTQQDVGNLIRHTTSNMNKYLEELNNPQTSEKGQYTNIRAFRNKTSHAHLQEMINYLDTVKNEKIKLAGIEMLGWFNYSTKRAIVSEFCNKLLNDSTNSEACLHEAQKTINRIKLSNTVANERNRMQ
jgi:hypothetical protein